MATAQELWAQAYGAPAASTYQAPGTTNYGNLSAGIGQDVLSRMQNTQMWDPSGGNGSGGSWGVEGGEPIYGSDPNGNPLPVTYGEKRLVWHPAGQGPGEQYPTFDPVTGEFKGYQTGSKVQSYASGIASVAGAGLGFGMIGGAAGAAGAAGGGAEAAGGAGVTGFGDAGTMYAGADAASAGSLGGGYSLAGGGAAAMGAGAAGGGGGAAGGAGPAASTGGLSSLFGGGSGSGFNWGSLVGPAIAGLSGVYGANQSKDAANALADAANKAAEQFKPWVDNGSWAINQAGNMLGRNGADAATAAFTKDPGYQFRLDQGNQALTRAAAASGTLGSGKYLKDAMTYNQGQASQEFGNSYNRLMGLAGMGQTATGSAADYTTSGASALASGKVAGANALTSALGQGLSMYNTGQQQNQNNQFQNALMQRWATGA